MSPLIQLLSNDDGRAEQDDTTLGACLGGFGNGKYGIEENINELQNVITWLKLNKLLLNIKKTKAMIFHILTHQT